VVGFEGSSLSFVKEMLKPNDTAYAKHHQYTYPLCHEVVQPSDHNLVVKPFCLVKDGLKELLFMAIVKEDNFFIVVYT